ncbi:hypothetical protein [Abyssogena phaseoliformis symbiont]|uniref:hypothetical protein n=1 Tax=Abyssogena phaseoliformis symbiont TaxID=596095 RepID=UPI0019166AC1|nr:hypothetical protein [Abyssogena phaseoliformis symbiont]
MITKQKSPRQNLAIPLIYLTNPMVSHTLRLSYGYKIEDISDSSKGNFWANVEREVDFWGQPIYLHTGTGTWTGKYEIYGIAGGGGQYTRGYYSDNVEILVTSITGQIPGIYRYGGCFLTHITL